MNCLLIEPHEIEADSRRVRLSGRRRRHAREILRAAVGDTLRVGLVGGRLGVGRVVGLDPEVLELDVTFVDPPPAKRPVCLVLALPRPPVFRRLLATVASLGVERLLIVATARTEKSFWQSHATSADAIRERLLLGLEQARDTVVPEVTLHRYFEPLVEQVLPSWVAGRSAFVAHPGAASVCPHAVEGPITLFVGPEGGLVDYEIERLTGIGFEAVSLGSRAIRVEPVVPMLLGRLS